MSTSNDLWKGVTRRARECGIDVVTFAGGVLRDLRGLRLQSARNFVYDLIDPEYLDGLLIFTGAMNESADEAEVRAFCARFQPCPMVSLSMDLAGIPSVITDNWQGTWDVVSHLIEVHGRRNLAFVSGPKGHQESEVRLAAFQACCQQYGLRYDPELVLNSPFEDEAGNQAVAVLYDQRSIRFDAMITLDDRVAIAAIHALQERGLSVPGAISVTGFDDQPMAGGVTPPLTTVSIDIASQGSLAVDVLRSQIKGDPVAPVTRLAQRMVVRRSCGCQSLAVRKAGGQKNERSALLLSSRDSTAKDEALRSFGEEVREIQPGEGWVMEWAEAFLKDVFREGASFLEMLEAQIPHITEEKSGVVDADMVLSALRSVFMPCLPLENHERAESILHAARVMVREAAQRREARESEVVFQQAMLMLDVAYELHTTFTQEELNDILVRTISQLGIPRILVAEFVDPAKPSGEAKVLFAYSREAHADGWTGACFPTRQLAPEDWFAADPGHSYVALPLAHRTSCIGYVLLEQGSGNGMLYETLAEQLSSAIQGIRLHTQVVEFSLVDGLTGVQNRRYFEGALQREVDRAYRYERDVALLMIDVDGFKMYNDTYGHPAGDVALQHVAACIQSSVRRRIDVVARYGGDEFVAILPETDINGAYLVALSMQAAIAGHAELAGHITISIGVASLHGRLVSASALVDAADQAVYHAKSAGRNRVVRG
jgi:diguanylate cyclase (GGDEF)-like protein